MGRKRSRWVPEYAIPARGTFTETAEQKQAGLIAVFCWCERQVLLVPVAVVHAGRTGMCGRSSCKPLVDA